MQIVQHHLLHFLVVHQRFLGDVGNVSESFVTGVFEDDEDVFELFDASVPFGDTASARQVLNHWDLEKMTNFSDFSKPSLL